MRYLLAALVLAALLGTPDSRRQSYTDARARLAAQMGRNIAH